jgi:hypothetical protein
MAKEVLLINPSPRRRRRRTTTRRTAAQKAATRRMLAARWGRKSNPVRRRRRSVARRRNPVARSMTTYRPRRRVARRRYSRNPIRGGMRGILNGLVIPAATAGAGALGLDIIWGYVPIPVTLKTGPARHVVKGLGAIVMGMAVGALANRRLGNTMALGALTVTMHDAMRELVANTMPQVPLGYYSPGMPVGSDPRLGYYVGAQHAPTGPSSEEMGYYVGTEGAY